MGRVKWSVSAGAVLLFALMYFFDGSGIVSAAIPAIVLHELGHYLALCLSRKRITRVCVNVTGVELNYAGSLGSVQALLCAAAGPVAGLLYGMAAARTRSAFLRMSGSASLALSVFNLLPVLPLDGGRIVSAVFGPKRGELFSRCFSVIVLLLGAAAAWYCRALSLLLMGAWLTVCNFRTR